MLCQASYPVPVTGLVCYETVRRNTKQVGLIVNMLGTEIHYTVITLNIGTPRPVTVVVLNIKQFNFTLK